MKKIIGAALLLCGLAGAVAGAGPAEAQYSYQQQIVRNNYQWGVTSSTSAHRRQALLLQHKRQARRARASKRSRRSSRAARSRQGRQGRANRR